MNNGNTVDKVLSKTLVNMDRLWRAEYRRLRHTNRRHVFVLSDTTGNAVGIVIRGHLDECDLEHKLRRTAEKWFPKKQFAYENVGVGHFIVRLNRRSVTETEVAVPALLKQDRSQTVVTLKPGELPFPYLTFIEALPFEVIEVPVNVPGVCKKFEELI